MVQSSVVGTSQHDVALFLQVSSMCSINIFGLISGYVGYGRKIKIENLFKMWLRVIFWTTVITMVFLLIDKSRVNGLVIRKTFLPIISQTYWYITAYFIVAILSPVTNWIVKRTNNWVVFICLCIVTVVLSIIHPTSGNNAVWLLLLYFYGAVLKKTGIAANKLAIPGIIGYVMSVLLTWIAVKLQESGIIIWNRFLWGLWGGRSDGLWPSSISMLLAALFLLQTGINLKLSKKTTEVLRKMTPLIFSVYLIHVHPLVFEVLKNAFVPLITKQAWIVAFVVLIVSMLIFVLCAGLDIPRSILFDKIEKKIKE